MGGAQTPQVQASHAPRRRRGLAAGHFARRAADRKLAAVLDEFEGRHRDAPADAPPDAAAADPAALRLF